MPDVVNGTQSVIAISIAIASWQITNTHGAFFSMAAAAEMWQRCGLFFFFLFFFVNCHTLAARWLLAVGVVISPFASFFCCCCRRFGWAVSPAAAAAVAF